MPDTYINREAVRREACKGCTMWGGGNICHDADPCEKLIAAFLNAPAADVAEVVHGQWVDNGIPDSILSGCSVCGFTCGSSSFFYCPNCGAKMDGGDGSVADDLERKLDETGKLVPRLYGDYVFSPCQNAFNGKTSWWLSKKDCTVAIYCFTAGTTAEVDAQLSAGGEQAYIQMFKERTGFRKKPARLAADFPVKYTEICALYHFCVDLGIKCTIERLYDGYAVRFPDGSDFAQHHGTYGGTEGCVEPAIGDSEFDYTAVGLNLAKELVKKHKANTASIRQIQGENGNVSD